MMGLLLFLLGVVVYLVVLVLLYFLKGKYDWKDDDGRDDGIYMLMIVWPIAPFIVILYYIVEYCITRPIDWAENMGRKLRKK